QDVRFLQLDVAGDHLRVDTFVMVMNRDRQDLLGPLLPNHVLVENSLDFRRLGHRGGLAEGLFTVGFLGNDVVAEVDTLIADVDCRAGNQFTDFILALAAEGATQVARAVFMLRHTPSRSSLGGPPANDYLIDQSVFNRLDRSHDVIAIGIPFDLPEILTGVLHENIIDLLARAEKLFGVNLYVACLTLRSAQRLMYDHPRMRQRVAMTFLARGEQQRAHTPGLSQAQS